MKVTVTGATLLGDKFTVTINSIKVTNTSCISINTAACTYLTVQDISSIAADLTYAYSDKLFDTLKLNDRDKLQRTIAKTLFNYLLA